MLLPVINSQIHKLKPQRRSKFNVTSLLDLLSTIVWSLQMEIFDFRNFIFSQLIEKLDISESTIESLNQQLTSLNQADSLARMRSQHEVIMSTLRQKHEEDLLYLKEKLDDTRKELNWKVFLLVRLDFWENLMFESPQKTFCCMRCQWYFDLKHWPFTYSAKESESSELFYTLLYEIVD